MSREYNFSTDFRFYQNRLVCMYVRPSVCFHDNSRTTSRRMMKLGTYILEVKSKIEFKDGSRRWPLTRSNWRFSECTFRGLLRWHSVQCTCMYTHPFLWNTCIYVLQQKYGRNRRILKMQYLRVTWLTL